VFNDGKIRKSKNGGEFLKKGDGKLSSNIDCSNNEIYERIKTEYMKSRVKNGW
jgi:hypothetical protein